MATESATVYQMSGLECQAFEYQTYVSGFECQTSKSRTEWQTNESDFECQTSESGFDLLSDEQTTNLLLSMDADTLLECGRSIQFKQICQNYLQPLITSYSHTTIV